MMRKCRISACCLVALLLLAAVAPMGAAAAEVAEPGYVMDFYTKESYDAQQIEGFKLDDCNVTWVEGDHAMLVTSGEVTTGDYVGRHEYLGAPYFRSGRLEKENKGTLKCDQYRYMAIRLKNLTAGTELGGTIATGSLGLDSDAGAFKFAAEPNMKEFKTYVVDMVQANIAGTQDTTTIIDEATTRWKGGLNQIRFEFDLLFGTRGSSSVSADVDLVEFQWIAFFETEEAAKAYKGPRGEDASNAENPPDLDAQPADPSDEPTETETEAPAESGALSGSEAPATTGSAGGNTTAPANKTPAAGNNSDTKDGGVSPVVWVVVAVAAVAVIAVVVTMVVRKKK